MKLSISSKNRLLQFPHFVGDLEGELNVESTGRNIKVPFVWQRIYIKFPGSIKLLSLFRFS